MKKPRIKVAQRIDLVWICEPSTTSESNATNVLRRKNRRLEVGIAHLAILLSASGLFLLPRLRLLPLQFLGDDTKRLNLDFQIDERIIERPSLLNKVL